MRATPTFLVFVLCLIYANVSGQTAQDQMTTYYFIRHAEKDVSDPNNKDPQLTQEGIQRARSWSEIFREIPFDLVFSTEFQRTRQTAQFIAESQKKSVQIYDHRNLNNDAFIKQTRGKTSLIVGHSNTNPRFVNLILGSDLYPDIEEKESGSLFIVQVCPEGTTSSQVLYIN